MGVDDKLLGEVVRRILSVARPEKIILFGSAAAGRMNRDIAFQLAEKLRAAVLPLLSAALESD